MKTNGAMSIPLKGELYRIKIQRTWALESPNLIINMAEKKQNKLAFFKKFIAIFYVVTQTLTDSKLDQALFGWRNTGDVDLLDCS